MMMVGQFSGLHMGWLKIDLNSLEWIPGVYLSLGSETKEPQP